MITLLMAFFIMLFVMSQTDLAKFKKFQAGLAGHYGKKVSLKGTDGVLMGAGAHLLVSDAKAQQALQAQAKQSAAAAVEKTTLTNSQNQIQTQLKTSGVSDQVKVSVEQRGLIVTVLSDK